jgi:Fanconi anemia group M protein
MPHALGIDVRDYQRAIAKSALESNTLVVLPTGLGKTVVALLVAVERLSIFPDGKVLVLAPTRPLVLQHARFFKEHLAGDNVSSATLTGESSPELRGALFQESRLVFATPEVVRNDVLEHRYMLTAVCLVVFDEAHRCVKEYAYSEVAEAYKREALNPLILGLTASPSARRDRILEICAKLAIENIEARSEADEDVAGYVKPVSLSWTRIALPEGYKNVSRILHRVLDEKVEKLRAMHLLPRDVIATKRMLLDLGEALHRRLAQRRAGYLFAALLLQSQAISLQHGIELVETQGITSLTRYLSRLPESENRSSRALANDPRIIDALERSESLAGVEHPKQARLRELVTEQLDANPGSKLIVFTQFRDTVEKTVENLNRVGGASAVRFVGQATRDLDDAGLKQSEQARILEEFRSGRYNVLVTTSIGEEGLHVPDVDHVVFYEAVPSEIRSIQRRGRTGRTSVGKVTVLMAEDTVDEAYYYSSRRKEQKMRHLLEAVKRRGIRHRKRKITLLDYLEPQTHPENTYA